MLFLILTIFYDFCLGKNNQNVKFEYTKNVKKQSIAKLIVVRLLRKLDNSIYQKWGDGQTVAAQGQTKGVVILLIFFYFFYLVITHMEPQTMTR